jgi:hypothetical protein
MTFITGVNWAGFNGLSGPLKIPHRPLYTFVLADSSTEAKFALKRDIPTASLLVAHALDPTPFISTSPRGNLCGRD